MNRFSASSQVHGPPFYRGPYQAFNKRSLVITVENCIPDRRVEEPPMSMNMILVYKSH